MRWAVIDFETTDLVKDGGTWDVQPGIVQIGAAIIDGERVTRTFQALINPEKTVWSAKAMEVNGLNPDLVKDAPTFYEIFPEFANFVNGSMAWVGYNTKFDRDVLFYQLQRYGFERRFPWPVTEIDVMATAGERLGGAGKQGNKRWKLVDAYREVFGKDYDGAHDAMNDVLATAELAIHWSK